MLKCRLGKPLAPISFLLIRFLFSLFFLRYDPKYPFVVFGSQVATQTINSDRRREILAWLYPDTCWQRSRPNHCQTSADWLPDWWGTGSGWEEEGGGREKKRILQCVILSDNFWKYGKIDKGLWLSEQHGSSALNRGITSAAGTDPVTKHREGLSEWLRCRPVWQDIQKHCHEQLNVFVVHQLHDLLLSRLEKRRNWRDMKSVWKETWLAAHYLTCFVFIWSLVPFL